MSRLGTIVVIILVVKSGMLQYLRKQEKGKMKILKGWIPTGAMIAVILMGTTFANAGVVVGGLKSDDKPPCTEIEKVDSGVVVGGFTGVVVGGFTGVVVGGLIGVVVGGFTGVVVGGLVDESPEKVWIKFVRLNSFSGIIEVE